MDRLGQPAVLVGRGGEYALIGAFLDGAAADGAIPLRGEPGAGRTVLLDAAADGASAAGAWVLRAGELASLPMGRHRARLSAGAVTHGLRRLTLPLVEPAAIY